MAIITGAQALIQSFRHQADGEADGFLRLSHLRHTIVLTLACFAFAEHWISRGCGRRQLSGDPTYNGANELKGDPIWPNKVSGLMVLSAGLLVRLHHHRL